MPKKKNDKVPPRVANHESLQNQYANASVPDHKRWGVNAILSLYQTGYIHTKKAAERQINNFLKPSRNSKLQQETFLKTLRKYYAKPPTRQSTRLSKLMERRDALAREGREAGLRPSLLTYRPALANPSCFSERA